MAKLSVLNPNHMGTQSPKHIKAIYNPKPRQLNYFSSLRNNNIKMPPIIGSQINKLNQGSFIIKIPAINQLKAEKSDYHYKRVMI